MALSVLFAMLLAQGEVGQTTTQGTTEPGQPEKPAQTAQVAAPKQVTSNVGAPLPVAEPVRLAITPILDGKIDDEEWDPFATTSDVKSFLEWEPGKLNVAGVVPKGHDLLVSIDLNDDGWLVGKDNLEVRASLVGDKVVLKARTLDATGKSGPAWSDAPSVVLGSEAVAKESDTETTYELTLVDSTSTLFNPANRKRYGVRCDVVPTGGAEPEAFVPRAMSEVTLETQRNAGMPKDLVVNIEAGFTTVTPGEATRLRVTFRGQNTLRLQKFEARSEGFAKDYTASLSTPFPTFDSKGRAFIDYSTKVASGAPFGYRVMRGIVTAADGLPGIVEGSYRVAPIVDFLMRTKHVKASEQLQIARVRYGVRSNSGMRVMGGIGATLPAGWRNMTPEDKGFIIYKKGWTAERTMQVEIPAGTVGTFPLKLRCVLGDQITEQTVFLTVQK